MTVQEFVQQFNLLSAVFGSVLTMIILIIGSAIAYQNYKLKKGETEFKLKVVTDVAVLMKGGGGFKLPMFSVAVNNTGRRMVTVNSIGFQLPNDRMLFFTKNHRFDIILPNLPNELYDGKSIQLLVEQEKLAKEIFDTGYKGKVKIRGFCKDAIGNAYYSDKFTIDLNEVLSDSDET